MVGQRCLNQGHRSYASCSLRASVRQSQGADTGVNQNALVESEDPRVEDREADGVGKKREIQEVDALPTGSNNTSSAVPIRGVVSISTGNSAESVSQGTNSSVNDKSCLEINAEESSGGYNFLWGKSELLSK